MPPRRRRLSTTPGTPVKRMDGLAGPVNDDNQRRRVSGQAGQEQEDESPSLLLLNFLLPPPRVRPFLPLATAPASQQPQQQKKKRRRVSSSSSPSSPSPSTSGASSSLTASATPTVPLRVIEHDNSHPRQNARRRYNVENFPHQYQPQSDTDAWTLVDCWRLHGRSHCPATEPPISRALDASPTAVDGSPSSTSLTAAPSTALPTPNTTETSDTIDMTDIPTGWVRDGRTELYPIPVIVVCSVLLASSIVGIIFFCVLLRKRSKARIRAADVEGERSSVELDRTILGGDDRLGDYPRSTKRRRWRRLRKNASHPPTAVGSRLGSDDDNGANDDDDDNALYLEKQQAMATSLSPPGKGSPTGNNKIRWRGRLLPASIRLRRAATVVIGGNNKRRRDIPDPFMSASSSFRRASSPPLSLGARSRQDQNRQRERERDGSNITTTTLTRPPAEMEEDDYSDADEDDAVTPRPRSRTTRPAHLATEVEEDIALSGLAPSSASLALSRASSRTRPITTIGSSSISIPNFDRTTPIMSADTTVLTARQLLHPPQQQFLLPSSLSSSPAAGPVALTPARSSSASALGYTSISNPSLPSSSSSSYNNNAATASSSLNSRGVAGNGNGGFSGLASAAQSEDRQQDDGQRQRQRRGDNNGGGGGGDAQGMCLDLDLEGKESGEEEDDDDDDAFPPAYIPRSRRHRESSQSSLSSPPPPHPDASPSSEEEDEDEDSQNLRSRPSRRRRRRVVPAEGHVATDDKAALARLAQLRSEPVLPLHLSLSTSPSTATTISPLNLHDGDDASGDVAAIVPDEETLVLHEHEVAVGERTVRDGIVDLASSSSPSFTPSSFHHLEAPGGTTSTPSTSKSARDTLPAHITRTTRTSTNNTPSQQPRSRRRRPSYDPRRGEEEDDDDDVPSYDQSHAHHSAPLHAHVTHNLLPEPVVHEATAREYARLAAAAAVSSSTTSAGPSSSSATTTTAATATYATSHVTPGLASQALLLSLPTSSLSSSSTPHPSLQLDDDEYDEDEDIVRPSAPPLDDEEDDPDYLLRNSHVDGLVPSAPPLEEEDEIHVDDSSGGSGGGGAGLEHNVLPSAPPAWD